MKRLLSNLSYVFSAVLLTFLVCCQQNTKPSIGQKTEPKVGLQTDTVIISDNTIHEDLNPSLKSDWPKRDTFTVADLDTLRAALVIANSVIGDTLFFQVLTSLADSNRIDWGNSRLESIPQQHRSSPTAFILSEFRNRGLNRLAEFQAYRWPDSSLTTGSVFACDTLPKVNTNKLDRGIRQIAGTMVHERIHSFCQKHRYNDRSKDECDLAYHAGNLSIALAAYRANSSRAITSRAEICDHLKKLLRQHSIIR